MPRYADVDKLIKELSTMYKSPKSAEDFMTVGYDHAIADVVVTVHEHPTADVVERKRGKWIKVGDNSYMCSVCGEISCCMGNYCPDCGADMREESEELREDN